MNINKRIINRIDILRESSMCLNIMKNVIETGDISLLDDFINSKKLTVKFQDEQFCLFNEISYFTIPKLSYNAVYITYNSIYNESDKGGGTTCYGKQEYVEKIQNYLLKQINN